MSSIVSKFVLCVPYLTFPLLSTSQQPPWEDRFFFGTPGYGAATRQGVFTPANEEVLLFGSAWQWNGTHGYFGGKVPLPDVGSPVVKFDLNTMTDLGQMTMEQGEVDAHCISGDVDFGYVGTMTGPGIVIKFNLVTMERVDRMQLSGLNNENLLATVAADGYGNFFFGTQTAPGRIIPIRGNHPLTGLMERAGNTLILGPQEGPLADTNAVINAATRDRRRVGDIDAFFGLFSVPARIVRVRLNRHPDLPPTPPTETSVETATENETESEGSNQSMSDELTAAPTAEPTSEPTAAPMPESVLLAKRMESVDLFLERKSVISLLPGEDIAWVMFSNPATGDVYVCPNVVPGGLVRVFDAATGAFQRGTSRYFGPGEGPIRGAISDGTFAYLITASSPALLFKIDLPTMRIASRIRLQEGEGPGAPAMLWREPSTVFVGLETVPAKVVVINAEKTYEPTIVPTAEPTLEPTPVPTRDPTMQPTQEPTLEPTATPTMFPTPEPTETPPTETLYVRPEPKLSIKCRLDTLSNDSYAESPWRQFTTSGKHFENFSEAFKIDLAKFFGVPPNDVEVLGSRLGSLIVDADVYLRSAIEEPEKGLENAVEYMKENILDQPWLEAVGLSFSFYNDDESGIYVVDVRTPNPLAPVGALASILISRDIGKRINEIIPTQGIGALEIGLTAGGALACLLAIGAIVFFCLCGQKGTGEVSGGGLDKKKPVPKKGGKKKDSSSDDE